MKIIKDLEKANRGFQKIDFIKSYPVLRSTNLLPKEIMLLELVLSFQSDKKEFQMSYNKIATYTGIGIKAKDKVNAVSKVVSKLNKLGHLITDNTPNVKGEKIYGGSKTTLAIDINELLEYIQSFKTKPKVNIPTAPTKEAGLVVEPVGDTPLETKPTSAQRLESPKEDTTTEPATKRPSIDDKDVSHIKFENFDVEETLRRYINNNSVILDITKTYKKYRTEQNIENYTLIDFVEHISKKFRGIEIADKIVSMIHIEINKIKDIEKYRAA